MNSPLRIYSDIVKPEWIDYNGHMTEAYYVLTFGFATEEFQSHVGGGEAYRERTGSSIYTVEAHINYLQEVKEGTPLNFSTHLLNFDEKRMHLFHEVLVGNDDMLVATTEVVALHVDNQPKVTSVPSDILEKLNAIDQLHKDIPVPRNAGRYVGL